SICVADSFQLSGAAVEILTDLFRGDTGSRRPGSRASQRRFAHIFSRAHHRLRAIGQTIDLASLARPPVIIIEGFINAAQYCRQRNTGLLPGLYQRPIQGGKQQQRAAPPLVSLLDLAEVLEIIFHRHDYFRIQRRAVAPNLWEILRAAALTSSAILGTCGLSN